MPDETPVKLRFHPVLQFFSRLRSRHFFAADLLLLLLTPALAVAIRTEGMMNLDALGSGLVAYTLLALFVRIPFFLHFGLYRRYWAYATVDDLVQIVRAVLASTAAIAVIVIAGLLLAPEALPPFPRSLVLMDSVLVLLAVGGIRFSARFSRGALRKRASGPRRPALILGAGEVGQLVVKELQANPASDLEPVGFLDDDPSKIGLEILGQRVWGDRNLLPALARQLGVKELIIATPAASGKMIRGMMLLCEGAGVAVRTVPSLGAILDGTVTVNKIRKVDIEDLLRRDPIRTDISAVRDLVNGKTVLITGGGGSIGSELCRQVLQCGPSHLVLLGHGENSVFEAQNELQLLAARMPVGEGELAPPIVSSVIADIRFLDRVKNVVDTVRPDIIFHAAAHKHVPLMELNPVEAVTNNIFGTRNLLDAALAAEVPHFVMISTDKAVNPTNVMGATKRAAELLVLAAARRSGRPYVAVRFGNVLGSRGSVVLTFRQQIAAGGPVTVSHPDMKRYFMTIPEAVQLVLQAAVLGRGGEIFVLDMGDPVRIVDLARDMIELSGLAVGKDIEIAYTGIRPGEKLFEELFLPGEEYQPTLHDKILIARNAGAFVPFVLQDALESLEDAVAAHDRDALARHLRTLVPEFNSPSGPMSGSSSTGATSSR
jgi:FlaA1/EpsC-like NDP-sugar epimerase